MDINTILTFFSENFTPLLTAITVLSFILNIIQYKTNRDVQYHLDSIYQSCINTIRVSEKTSWTKEEYIHILYLIRIQAVSGLRSLGIKRVYGAYDQVTNQGFAYRFLSSTYMTLRKVKEKWPLLFGKGSKDSEKTSDSKNNL